jgi:hypothetical protein
MCEEEWNRFGASLTVPRFFRDKAIRTTRARNCPSGREAILTAILPGFDQRRSCT